MGVPSQGRFYAGRVIMGASPGKTVRSRFRHEEWFLSGPKSFLSSGRLRRMSEYYQRDPMTRTFSPGSMPPRAKRVAASV